MSKGNMQRGNINKKLQGRNGGTMGGADRNWLENRRRTLEVETAGLAQEEGLGRGNEIVGNPLGVEGLTEDVGIHIVKPTFDVQEERGDLAAGALKSADYVN